MCKKKRNGVWLDMNWVIRGRLIAFLSITTLIFGCASTPVNGKNSTRAPSDSHEDKCQSPLIHSISIPLYGDSQESQKIPYRYKFLPPTDPESPTVVFLQGGPGGTSMEYNREDFQELPPGVGILLLDPRGVGCNSADLPPEAYQTRFLAEDVIEIIDQLKLNNYILYGASYGTLLATVVAGTIESGTIKSTRRVPPPRAIVLTGVIGKEYKRGTWSLPIVNGWEQIKRKLPKNIIKNLSAEPLPFGASPLAWGRFITFKMNEGDHPGGGSELEFRLQNLFSTATDPHVFESEKNWLLNLEKGPSADEARLYRYIACREIAADQDGNDSSFQLKSGQLIPPHDEKFCSGVGQRDPFDSALWLTSSPIFYLQGDKDLSTPLFQGEYHFRNQKRSHRTFVQIAGGGHTVSRVTWLYGKCSLQLWNQILSDASPISTSECPAGTFVTQRPA
jgi:pimeloyl-ACP methyl ester carboxylesterase